MKWVYIFITLCWSVVSFAEILDFQKSGKLYISVNQSWELKKDVFGFPFIIFSQMEKGQRSNMSFIATGENLSFDTKKMQAEIKDYEDMKKQWAERIGAKLLKTYPLVSSLNSKGHKVHKIGVDYEHEKKHYKETSYYLECRGRMYFSKSLMLIENQNHQAEVDRIIKEIDCE